jgi:Arm domain-containing DNA-binding protein
MCHRLKPKPPATKPWRNLQHSPPDSTNSLRGVRDGSEPCKPSTTRSGHGCHPCLRYVLSPMCPARTSKYWSGRRESNPRHSAWEAIQNENLLDLAGRRWANKQLNWKNLLRSQGPSRYVEIRPKPVNLRTHGVPHNHRFRGLFWLRGTMRQRQIEMTDLWMRNASTDDAREEWRDSRQPNLELRVTAKGTKTWRVHYTRSDGQRKAIKLGRYSSDGVDGLTLAQARKKARETRVDVDHGRDPAGARRALRDAPTFAEVAEEWSAYRQADPNHNPNSLNDDRGMLKRTSIQSLVTSRSRIFARRTSCASFESCARNRMRASTRTRGRVR